MANIIHDVNTAWASFQHESSVKPTTVIAALAVTVGIWLVNNLFQTWRRLSHVPGPFLNSITPLVLTYHCLKEDINTYVYNLSLKYGPLVRVSPNIVAHFDPETFRYVCSYKANYTKGLWFEFSRWDLEHYSCIAMRDNESRKERKTKLVPAWSGQYMSVMESRVDSQVHAFIDLVERKYLSTSGVLRPMDFGHRAQFFTLDVATSATFGKPFGFLQKDGDVEKYLETTESMTPAFGILGTLPWLVYAMHAWPLKMFMPGEGDAIGFGRLMKFASEAVKQRLDPDDTNTEYDLIRGYLRNGVEPEDAVQECITLVYFLSLSVPPLYTPANKPPSVAGSETTSIALRMALLSLLTTPSSYRKVQSEIDAFFASQSAPSSSSIISFSAAKTHLPYTQAVIREALRLWPPSAGLFSKQVPEQGDTLHGYYLPKGTEVGQSMMGVGRQERIFGSDAEIFRPERWTEADVEKFEEMQAAVDLVFSAGKYVCLGKQVAWMELVKWFAEVSWCRWCRGFQCVWKKDC